jgi:glycosyltransferase involved in cell wall biosynthesis
LLSGDSNERQAAFGRKMLRGKLLFVHTNFPAQFGPVAMAAAEAGAQCVVIGSETARGVEGVEPVLRWSLKRGTTSNIFPLAVRAEADLLRGRAAADCALQLKAEGFEPDVIVGHPGWGETLFLREIFPAAKQLLYGEFYYHASGADVGFDPEFPAVAGEEPFRVHAKNATLAMALAEADQIVCATPFQASLLPSVFQPRTAIIHEGVETQSVVRRRSARVRLQSGQILDDSKPVVTFVNRHLEPLRGFHIFMRALPALLDSVPDAHALVIGDNRKGYGQAAPDGATWKERLVGELGDRLDFSRVHFLGRVRHAELLAAFSISRAHVYYTYPFVLSWSLLEAMACECLIIGSDTAPLHDVITHGRNGILLDFFDVAALSDTLIQCCRRPREFDPMRAAARATILDRFDRQRHGLPAWQTLLDSMVAPAGSPTDSREQVVDGN